MGKKRIIFYSIFGAYQLITFIFTVVIDTKDTSALFSIYGYLPWFKYLSSIGVMLIIIDFVWAWSQNNRTKNEAEEFRLENNTLKARIYDFQEKNKQTTPSVK